MFKSCLGMRMSKRISCPSNSRRYSELLIQKVMSDGVLIKNVIHIAHCLVVLDPPSISNFKLAVLQQLFNFILFIGRKRVVPILEENDLSDEKFSGLVGLQCCKHRV